MDGSTNRRGIGHQDREARCEWGAAAEGKVVSMVVRPQAAHADAQVSASGKTSWRRHALALEHVRLWPRSTGFGMGLSPGTGQSLGLNVCQVVGPGFQCLGPSLGPQTCQSRPGLRPGPRPGPKPWAKSWAKALGQGRGQGLGLVLGQGAWAEATLWLNPGPKLWPRPRPNLDLEP